MHKMVCYTKVIAPIHLRSHSSCTLETLSKLSLLYEQFSINPENLILSWMQEAKDLQLLPSPALRRLCLVMRLCPRSLQELWLHLKHSMLRSPSRQGCLRKGTGRTTNSSRNWIQSLTMMYAPSPEACPSIQ